METTFMTIHNLSPEANIQWASESIFEVLGYQQHEVTGKSCFEYFHPDEIPFARMVHNKGVALDKAAVLHYARIKGKTGEWIGCECVFTVVHDVLVACTSIYKGDENNERRAAIAPAIRRIFSSSPRDPRYHMLEELSVKFRSPPQAALREPRAALILNRFSRELPVLYATSAVQGILGVSAEQITGKAFYECIQENCLPEAIRCLESAKANDSIAYLRFWYRDPRRPEDLVQNDEEMQDANHSSDSEDGGVELHSPMVLDPNSAEGSAAHQSRSQSAISSSGDDSGANQGAPLPSRTSSGNSSEAEHAADQVFDGSAVSRSSTSSLAVSPGVRRARPEQRPAEARPEPFELEAVISCTSDGLVVVLRRARPIVPDAMQQQVQYPNGLFAAPWGADPIRAHQFRADDPRLAFRHGLQIPQPQVVGGPPADQFLQTIREVAVFAWSLAGINGNIASYGRGTPRGEAQPPAGLPIWDPRAQPGLYVPPQNQAAERWMHVDERTRQYGHDYRLPYQYRWHQEQSLTYQPGLGIGPIVPPPQTVPADAWNGQHYRNPGYDIYANIFHGQNVSNQGSGYGEAHAGWNGGAQHPKPDQGPGGNPGNEY